MALAQFHGKKVNRSLDPIQLMVGVQRRAVHDHQAVWATLDIRRPADDYVGDFIFVCDLSHADEPLVNGALFRIGE
jgi:hypothetical protein